MNLIKKSFTKRHWRYRNVFLSSAELAELQTELPSFWEQYIERLSEYMESSGKGYKNHAATIRRCVNADKKKEERKAMEEQRERMERIKRRKAQGLQDRYLYDYTFLSNVLSKSRRA